MKRNLLFVIDGIEFGGGERGFAQIINGLPPEKYEIFLASERTQQFCHSIANKQVHFCPLSFSRRLNLPLIRNLIRIIKHNGIEIVHGQGARAELHARIANKLAGRSSYVSTVQMPVEGYDVGFFRKKSYIFFDRLSERFVDRFVVVSEVLKNRMIQEHRIQPERIVKIYNGVELDLYKSTRESSKQRNRLKYEFNMERDTVLIGGIGRLVWQKGFEYLIEAVPQIVSAIPEAKFLIVGEGPLRRELGVLTRKLGVNERVIFTGFRNDIRDVLATIDVLVVPSLLEGFPMITLEAMAMAKPIVATAINGITEQVANGEDGIFVPPRDSAALANAIIRLLSDRKSAQIMGMLGRKKVEQEFSVERMVSETEKVYMALLNRHETLGN